MSSQTLERHLGPEGVERLNNLLSSWVCMQHWLQLFSVEIKEKRAFGPIWESMNRRYELARYVYDSWYSRCTRWERDAFHEALHNYVATWDTERLAEFIKIQLRRNPYEETQTTKT